MPKKLSRLTAEFTYFNGWVPAVIIVDNLTPSSLWYEMRGNGFASCVIDRQLTF
jgi:hypothetical protein